MAATPRIPTAAMPSVPASVPVTPQRYASSRPERTTAPAMPEADPDRHRHQAAHDDQSQYRIAACSHSHADPDFAAPDPNGLGKRAVDADPQSG